MAKRIKKGRIITIAVLVCLLLVASAVAVVYLFAFDEVAIVTSSAWGQTFPLRDRLGLAWNLALDGCRLEFESLSDFTFFDPGMFEVSLAQVNADYAILDPVATSYAIQNSIDVSSVMGACITIGIGTGGDSLFDALLVSDERSGWLRAAEAIQTQTSVASRNVALVYESSVIDYAKDIVGVFPSGAVSAFDRSLSGNMFYSNTVSDLDRLGIVIALCPYVSDMDNLFSKDCSASWVVDYRFRSVVPSEYLFGVVSPDLLGAFGRAKGIAKGQHVTMDLEYVYDRVGKVF